MFFAIFFTFWRFMQIITLNTQSPKRNYHPQLTKDAFQQIPTMGMLAYFVNGYVQLNQLTPNYILVLFIVSVIALAWSIYTLFSYHRSSSNATFVAVLDLLFVGAFIGAVYSLRMIAAADCTSISRGDPYDVSFGPFGSASLTNWDANVDKTCAMLKASFAFGIMNCVFFFMTSILACLHGDRHGGGADRPGYYRETHHHRHGHRSSRSPHSSRHSTHSHRRVYV
ncbi:uncharacterized protein GGS25DRAFT_525385 [Hypoxylon fragiforme]|uniref:uncharacterized protein n=1 Tax=Hypoxylon fragiforme TaxID=63214 RepID=UPI0020C6E824|nr:uncharacterized protein GGS25DRAFT_525385 [Hypoxylon fragiforme]KAI2604106.1 hypothetical protein GGS25DRAFT_525385 [Hypoxylon fragiforme]